STLRSHVIKTLRERGPLPSRSIEDKSDKNWRSKGWTNERNVSRMLDFLLIKGEIMVAARSGGQKLWDLAERCLPDWTPRTTLSEYEIARHVTEKSLRALGVAPLRQIQQYFARKYYGNTEKVLSDLEREGVINRVEIDGLNQKKQSTWYIHCGDLPLVSEIESGHYSPRTTLLSPFDNLIWDRVRTKELFDFIMSLEIYVPKPKRKFGYYVLPILHGDKLIGRIDPKMDRENKRLVINSIHAETSSPKDGVTGRAIGSAIESLAEFLGAKEIAYPERVPNAWRNSLG
ncbi:MAG: DNA glycosylase AlkZ-like family protein, partial [Nitrososphaerales archaeon]